MVHLDPNKICSQFPVFVFQDPTLSHHSLESTAKAALLGISGNFAGTSCKDDGVIAEPVFHLAGDRSCILVVTAISYHEERRSVVNYVATSWSKSCELP
jgi:hypothetical protein